MNIQLYNGVKDTKGNQVAIESILQTINGPSNAFPVKKVRDAYKELLHLKALHEAGTIDQAAVDKQQAFYDAEKRNLPAVTWSGTFSRRAAVCLIDYSGLVCIDIDKLSLFELNTLQPQLCKDKYTHICFVSPSGNGLKVIVRVKLPTLAATPDKNARLNNQQILRFHKEIFLQLEQYYFNTYQIAIDQSGKDVSRLCFLSSDKELCFKKASAEFEYTPAAEPITEAVKKELSKTTAAEKKQLQSSGQTCNDIFDSTQQVIQYGDGNRNNFIFKFACNCNRVGITEIECVSFAAGFAIDVKETELKSTIKSAYAHNANEHGKYKRTDKRTATKPDISKGAATVSKRPAGKFIPLTIGTDDQPIYSQEQPPYIFWKEHKTEKGRGEKKYTVSRLELSRVDFCDFLKAEGFHLLKTGDEEGFQIVHSGDGIIKTISPQQIKHYSLDWCRRYGLKEVEEMLRKGQTKYFAKNELDSLPYKEVVLKRDNYEFSYYYFQNCYVRVSNKGLVEKLDYSQVDGYIWESNKIKHDFEPVKINCTDENDQLLPYAEINCEFARFIAYCSYNPLNDDEKDFSRKLITDRFFSFCSSIGWLLDGYKHPANRTSIFAVDHKIGDRNEANGRTGKSMIPQACALMKKVANISGKSYDPKYQFCDEPITVDTQIINFNDMQRNFDVENIFEKIADPYSVNRRNQGFIHFAYINSPKIYYSTNFTPKGDGESYKSRMNVIEFSDYFSGSNTPYDEFGHGFFDESWDADEWQRFYNFMIWCVAYFKEYGLQTYPMPNMEARKLINDVVPEFIDYMEDTNLVPKNTRLKKIELQDKFNEIYMQLYNKKLTAHTFTSWLKKFCTTKNYNLNPLQKGKHDKSNSIEYITIADEKWQEIQTKLL